jgi:hypothetical protein
MIGRPGSLRVDQLEVERDGDPARDLVLQGEQFTRVAIEPFRPQMRLALGIDQLNVDAHLAARAADAPLQHIAHAELAADLPRVGYFALVGKGGAAGDDKASRNPRQIGRQVVGNAVREVFLLRIAAEVGKRHHDDRQARRRTRGAD